MMLLALGLVLFLGIHLASVVGVREPAVARLGEGTWKGLYALVSIVGLVAIVYGYGQARTSPVLLYVPPVGLRHLVLLTMMPVFPLLFAAYMPGRIQRALKHPMLIATLFWALSHLLANGMLADTALFGGFFVWAAITLVSLMRRATPRSIPMAPASRLNDVLAVVLGLGTYVLFVVWAHRWLFGVAPVS